MNAFQKWMKVKKYNQLQFNIKKTGDSLDLEFYDMPKQMLIGYMIEYLLSTGRISFRRIGHWLGDEIHDSLLMVDSKFNGDNYINVIYDILEEKIKELK